MIRTIKNIGLLSMAFLVLTASMGFTINKHFCCGELKKIAINKQVELCAMCKAAEERPVCHKEQNEKACCENEQDKVEINNLALVKKLDKQFTSDFEFLAVAPVLLANIHINLSDNSLLLKEYSPPLIARDIPVEVQSLLL